MSVCQSVSPVGVYYRFRKFKNLPYFLILIYAFPVLPLHSYILHVLSKLNFFVMIGTFNERKMLGSKVAKIKQTTCFRIKHNMQHHAASSSLVSISLRNE